MIERDTLQVEVGRRIRALRLARGWTMAQLAEVTDMSVQYVSEIEHGKKSMTLSKLYSMAQALEVSVDRLISEQGKRRGASEEVVQLLEDMTPLDRELATHMLETTLSLLHAMKEDAY